MSAAGILRALPSLNAPHTRAAWRHRWSRRVRGRTYIRLSAIMRAGREGKLVLMSPATTWHDWARLT